MKTIIFAIAVLLMASTVQATENQKGRTAEYLYQACLSDNSSSLGSAKKSYCYGYILGITEMENALIDRFSFCFKGAITLKAIADLYVDFYEKEIKSVIKHTAPESRVVLIMALQHYFPCGESY